MKIENNRGKKMNENELKNKKERIKSIMKDPIAHIIDFGKTCFELGYIRGVEDHIKKGSSIDMKKQIEKYWKGYMEE